MQRPRSGLDLFPETIDLNQGSVPNSASNADTIHPPSWRENTINQMETQLPTYMRMTNGDPSVNPVITATNDSAPSYGGWDRGESSSGGFNLQDESCNEVSKSRLGWSSSSSSESWFFEPVNISANGTVRPQSSQSYYGANHGSLNINRDHGHVREGEGSQRHVLGAVLPHNIYKSGHHEIEQLPSFYNPSSSSNMGNCNNLVENSAAAWGGSSCKRKAAEGTSGSSSNMGNHGKNVMQHHGASCCNNNPGNSIISSGLLNPPTMNQSEPQNTSAMFGVILPPGRNSSSRSNLGQQTVPHDATVSSSYRIFGVNRDLSRPVSTALTIDPNGSLSQASSTNVTAHSSSSPWNDSLTSQHGGSSSRSHLFEEANHLRSSRGNSLHCPTNASEAEARNSVLTDQIDWSFAPETSSSRNRPYGSRSGSSSNDVRASTSSWLPHHYHYHHHHHHQTSQNHHQRFSEAAPWVQYPRIESEAGNNNSGNSNNRRSHFGYIPSSVSSSSNEAGSSSRARRQLDQRSAAALLMDISGDDVNGWHSITAVEERHRLIRQVLNAMRRGVHLQAEDYMVFDPYMDEFAELHDRHRDMRLDVDNMSYEELLALEETIGNVSTGLTEEKITASIKQRKHNNSMESMQNSEPCCICQEEYVAGDAIGVLDCSHEFHTGCIRQWLTQKNLCPICKTTALET